MSGSYRDQGQPDQRSSTVIDDKDCREQVGLEICLWQLCLPQLIFQHKELSGGLRRGNTCIPFQPCSPAVLRGAVCMFT